MDDNNPWKLKNSITCEEVLAFLNDALRLDRDAISRLFNQERVPCNASMAAHPTIQVQEQPPVVGVLGILNGMFGADEEGWGAFSMEVDGDGKVLQFFKTPTPLERQWGPTGGDDAIPETA